MPYKMDTLPVEILVESLEENVTSSLIRRLKVLGDGALSYIKFAKYILVDFGHEFKAEELAPFPLVEEVDGDIEFDQDSNDKVVQFMKDHTQLRKASIIVYGNESISFTKLLHSVGEEMKDRIAKSNTSYTFNYFKDSRELYNSEISSRITLEEKVIKIQQYSYLFPSSIVECYRNTAFELIVDGYWNYEDFGYPHLMFEKLTLLTKKYYADERATRMLDCVLNPLNKNVTKYELRFERSNYISLITNNDYVDELMAEVVDLSHLQSIIIPFGISELVRNILEKSINLEEIGLYAESSGYIQLFVNMCNSIRPGIKVRLYNKDVEIPERLREIVSYV